MRGSEHDISIGVTEYHVDLQKRKGIIHVSELQAGVGNL